MMKYDHIYTLNHNISRLNQQIEHDREDSDTDDDDNNKIVIKPSSNYNVEEDKDPKYQKKINHLDDLPSLIDDLLVYRCVQMLKQLSEDTSASSDNNQDNVLYLIYNSDDIYIYVLFFQF